MSTLLGSPSIARAEIVQDDNVLRTECRVGGVIGTTLMSAGMRHSMSGSSAASARALEAVRRQ
jgi:hypothetical protein